MTEPEPIEAEIAEVLDGVEPQVAQDARNLPAVRESEAIVARGEITVDEVVAQKEKIKQVMERVMTSGTHYGVIPGTQKPSLLKPGAEAILVALRLAPHYESEKVIDGQHLTVFVKCSLHHIPTGLVIATGEGMCSTHESRYATRTAKRACPECGEPQIRRSKFPPKPDDAIYVEGGPNEPGWYCWKKEGGCGANFTAGDDRITSQEEGKIENPDLPDQWNTVLKMADKRALIAAVLNGTAASDVFTQDVEDAGGSASGAPEPTESQARRQQPERRQEGPAPFPVPKNWPDIELAVKLCDNREEAWELFKAFLRAASYHLFGETDQEKLTKEQRMVLIQKASGAAVWLHENVEHEGPGFFFFDETQQRRAWAAMLDGGPALAIPDYTPPEPEHPQVDEEAERLAREAFRGAGEQ